MAGFDRLTHSLVLDSMWGLAEASPRVNGQMQEVLGNCRYHGKHMNQHLNGKDHNLNDHPGPRPTGVQMHNGLSLRLASLSPQYNGENRGPSG